MRTLIERHIPDLLNERPSAAPDQAERSGLRPLSLGRALRALTAFGVFAEVAPGVFANNDASKLFRNQPGGLRNWALFATSDQFLRSASALGHSLETGLPAHDHAFGQTVWEYLRDHPDAKAAFSRGLAEVRKEEHAEIAHAYDWAGITSVLDVGGGAGSLAVAILDTCQDMRAMLLERPDVLGAADQLLRNHGVRERCNLLGGSFFESISASADAWILSQVLHDWSDADCRKILQLCREGMRSTDRLLVIEMVPVPGTPNPAIAVIDISMMIFAGEARQRTVEEYRALIEARLL